MLHSPESEHIHTQTQKEREKDCEITKLGRETKCSDPLILKETNVLSLPAPANAIWLKYETMLSWSSSQRKILYLRPSQGCEGLILKPTCIPLRTQSPVWILIVTPTKLLLRCLFSQRKSRAFLAYSYN